MNFKEALEFLKEGYKIKRADWVGYWLLEDGRVYMYCKDGKILDLRETEDTLYTLENIVADDWEVLMNHNYAVEYHITTMRFGEAIRQLKLGKRVARKGWNGKGIYLELQLPTEKSKMTLPYIYIVTNGLVTDNPDAPKGIVPWLASQTDMLSEDWILVD